MTRKRAGQPAVRTAGAIRRSSIRAGRLTAVVLAAPVAVAVAGCGDGEAPVAPSSPPVARVGGEVVSRADVDRWVAVFAGGQPRSGGPVAVPDPPRFSRCAAALGRQPVPEGTARAGVGSRAQRRARCRRGYRQLKDQAMAFLVEAMWIEAAAAKEGIEVDSDRLSERFDRELADTFPSREALDRHLAQSGQTREDALYRLRLVEIQSRLMARAKAGVEVTDQDIARHYRTHRELFDAPLASVKTQVARAVRAQHEEQTLDHFTTDIRHQMRPRTWCAPQYQVAQCKPQPSTAMSETARPRGATQ